MRCDTCTCPERAGLARRCQEVSSLASAGRLITELRRRAPADGLRIALGGASVTNGEAVEIGRSADLATEDPDTFLRWLSEIGTAHKSRQVVDERAHLPQAD